MYAVNLSITTNTKRKSGDGLIKPSILTVTVVSCLSGSLNAANLDFAGTLDDLLCSHPIPLTTIFLICSQVTLHFKH
jgi:hypothetical protein